METGYDVLPCASSRRARMLRLHPDMDQTAADRSVAEAPGSQRLTEIRIHGRGGQGNMVAAYILAQAAFEQGRFGQAFPSFGPERRGAPVSAFVRIAERPLRRYCQVLSPDFLIIQDDGLLRVAGIMAGLRAGGGILVNSAKDPRELETQLEGALTDNRLIVLPASALATEFLGKPMPNTALLAAFLALTELLPLEALEHALERRFRDRTLAQNLALVREAASRVPAGLWKEAADA